MNQNLQPLRSFTMGQIQDMEKTKLDFKDGHPNFPYEAGLIHGRDQLLSEIYNLICYDNHPTDCPCHPCDILNIVGKGRTAFFITDETTREASKTRSRQGYLNKDIQDRQPELGYAKDPDCSVCHGIPDGCMLDTTNWRLCPHAI